jgi:hypothetical protein
MNIFRLLCPDKFLSRNALLRLFRELQDFRSVILRFTKHWRFDPAARGGKPYLCNNNNRTHTISNYISSN